MPPSEGKDDGRQLEVGHQMEARPETNLLPLCLCAQRTAGGVNNQENKNNSRIREDDSEGGEVETSREAGDHREG